MVILPLPFHGKKPVCYGKWMSDRHSTLGLWSSSTCISLSQAPPPPHKASGALISGIGLNPISIRGEPGCNRKSPMSGSTNKGFTIRLCWSKPSYGGRGGGVRHSPFVRERMEPCLAERLLLLLRKLQSHFWLSFPLQEACTPPRQR